jgi:hypothetical protein
MVFGFSNELIVQVSFGLIILSLVIIAASLIILFLRRRKTIEEKHADHILKTLSLLKEGKSVSTKKEVKKELAISKDETSLKQMLIKKFKPKIEHQLNTKINVLDFNAKENKFLALVEISGVRILLTLDASGQILDYKKIKA